MGNNTRKCIRGTVVALFAAVALTVGVTLLIRPIALTEALFQHNHCIKILDGALQQYASEHNGQFPTHTNGYGDALLLLHHFQPFFSGPGYSEDVFRKALMSGGDVPESQCGRVYVQGLRESSNPEIAIVFDK